MSSDQPATPRDESGMNLNFGTYEEALGWIGRSTDTCFGEVSVNEAMIRYYASSIEDGNASYWDREFADACWGGAVAPPGMLQTWTIPMQWRPDGKRAVATMAAKVPLPGEKPINVTTEFEYFLPLREGDVVNMRDTLVAITPEKTTKIGTGHFITTVGEYRNQRGELVARSTNVLFRYRAV